MLGLGVAEECGALLAVVSFPFRKQLVAIAVAHLRYESVGGMFDGAIAKGVHGDADRQLRKRVAFRRAGQNRALIAEPEEITHKHQYEQTSRAECYREMDAGEFHSQ